MNYDHNVSRLWQGGKGHWVVYSLVPKVFLCVGLIILRTFIEF